MNSIITSTGNGDFSESTTKVYVDTSTLTISALQEVQKEIKQIKDRLCLLDNPDSNLMKKYPALKEAYENYKMIEKLVNENNK